MNKEQGKAAEKPTVCSGVPKESRGEERKRTEETKDEKKERREKEETEKGRKLHVEIEHMLNRQITDNYLKDMKLNSRPYLEPAIVCKCTSPSDIFDKLEMMGYISIGNYEILKNVLKAAGLVNVSKMVEKMEKDILPNTTPATSYEFETVQKELKTWYWDNMNRIHPLPMCEWVELDLKHVFTNLQVVEGKKRRHSDSFKEQSSRPTNDPEILDRIFKVTPSERNICFIEGPAGIGKSTLCRRFAYLWSKDGYKIHGHHFDLVGILEARSLTKDFRKSFVQELFPDEFPEDEICQHFQTGKSLLIIDGVDELTAHGKWAITQLLEGKFFRNVHLIITGRPESVRKFLPYAKLHLEVKGFSGRNVEDYICKYFRNDENNYKMKLLERLEYDRELSELVVNPFVTVLLCILVQAKSGEIPSNSWEIYHEVMWTICGKYVKKLHEQGDWSLNEEMLYNAARYVACTGVIDNVFVFPENDLNSLFEGDLGFHLLKSGILSKDYTISRLHSNEFCYFPHRSFQEFFFGAFLEEQDLDEFKKEVLPSFPHSPAILACLRYLLSTKVIKIKIVLEHLFEIVAHDKKESFSPVYDWIDTTLSCLSSKMPSLDLVDFFRIHFNRSFKVARAILADLDGDYDHVQLAICKMDLPPFAYFENAGMEILGDKMNTWVDILLSSNLSSKIRKTYLEADSRLLKHFTKSNGAKMPFIHCNDIRNASTFLKKLRRLGVLSIAIWPHRLNYTDLRAFQQDLTSVENKINIIFVFLEARYDDSRFPNFISLMKGYSSDKVKIQVITVKPFYTVEDMPAWVDPDTEDVDVDYFANISCQVSLRFHGQMNEFTEYILSRPPHIEYYDRFCPY